MTSANRRVARRQRDLRRCSSRSRGHDRQDREPRHEDGVGRMTVQQSRAAQRRLARDVAGDRATRSTSSAATTAVRVVVLSGAGGKAFVSGADISKFESERASAEAVVALQRDHRPAAARAQRASHKPTIAQITGSCIGGGVALAVCCDLRICGRELALRRSRPRRLGLGYGFDGINRLVDVVGPPSPRRSSSPPPVLGRRGATRWASSTGCCRDAEVASVRRRLRRRRSADNAPLTVALGQGDRRRGV